VSLTELRCVITQEQDEPAADRAVAFVKTWPLQWVHSDEQLCLTAGSLKAFHRLSLAAAYVAAAAKLYDAALVHKDPEFEALEGEVRLAPLPYKTGGNGVP